MKDNVLAQALERPRLRLPFVILLHLGFSLLSLTFAFWLRFDFTLGGETHKMLYWYSLPINAVLLMVFSWVFNLYQGIWRYVSVDDLKDIVKTAAISSLAFMFVIVLSGRFAGYPRSIYLLNFAVYVILNGGMRFTIRVFRESFAPMSESVRNVLIVGAGGPGNEIAKTLKSAKRKEYIPVGFIDEDKRLHGKRMQGLKILGGLSAIRGSIRRLRVQEVLIAIPDASNKVVKKIIEDARIPDWDVKFKILPSMLDIMSGKYQPNRIRDVSIADLLSRPKITLDDSKVRSNLLGKIVMVTGAGGSIGSEICYQVSAYRPRKVILLDMSEENAYHIDREMKNKYPEIEFITAIGSIADKAWVDLVMKKHAPEYVYHAAAYKHVHLMEWNISTCLQNNVIGTRCLADAAVKTGTEKFVMISTDKAVRPKGIMGLSKRIAERVVLERDSSEQTIFNVVRFGNVLGSSGSVVPLFQEQIRAGGPITVTHPETTRYFMSIPEAVQLVLQAATLENRSHIYLLEMGEPVKIVELARSLIELSGLKVGDDVEIKFSGLREGEKLHEELLIATEDVIPTVFEKIRAQKRLESNPQEVRKLISDLETAILKHDVKDVLAVAEKLVPEGCL